MDVQVRADGGTGCPVAPPDRGRGAHGAAVRGHRDLRLHEAGRVQQPVRGGGILSGPILRGGIDLGGTKIQTAVVGTRGKVYGEARRPTPTSGGAPGGGGGVMAPPPEGAGGGGGETSGPPGG